MLGQFVWYDFKVQKQTVVCPIEEEFQYAAGGGDFEVEGAIDEFEVTQAALIQLVHFVQKNIDVEWPGGFVQR